MSFVVGWGDPHNGRKPSVIPSLRGTQNERNRVSNPLVDGSIPSRPMTKIKKRVDL